MNDFLQWLAEFIVTYFCNNPCPTINFDFDYCVKLLLEQLWNFFLSFTIFSFMEVKVFLVFIFYYIDCNNVLLALHQTCFFFFKSYSDMILQLIVQIKMLSLLFEYASWDGIKEALTNWFNNGGGASMFETNIGLRLPAKVTYSQELELQTPIYFLNDSDRLGPGLGPVLAVTFIACGIWYALFKHRAKQRAEKRKVSKAERKRLKKEYKESLRNRHLRRWPPFLASLEHKIQYIYFNYFYIPTTDQKYPGALDIPISVFKESKKAEFQKYWYERTGQWLELSEIKYPRHFGPRWGVVD